MEIIIQPTADAAIKVAAQIITRLLRDKPNAVLGMATGATPVPLYKELARMKLDWRRVVTFNLDEYVGLPSDHPQSYHHYMWENLFRHVNIARKNVHIPDGLAKDIPKFSAKYEKQILAAGGIDLQILGIGTNGHIGFNEPSSSLTSRTRIKTLTPQTVADNARFFSDEDKVPHHVITMGIGTIMDARQTLLLAFGEKKAGIIAETIEGPMTADNPASALQMHPRAVFCLDDASAARLKRADYYRWAYDKKPDWQKC